VSVLLIAAIVVAFGMCVRSKMPETKIGERFTACAPFRDGSRLAIGSPVMIAGVRIGEVTRLTIEGDHARVDMRLLDDTRVPNDAWVTKRAYSPFGDSYIEIIPGGTDTGASSTVMLRPGECFTKVAEGASTDRLLRTVANTMPRVDQGLERMAEVSAVGRKWAVGVLEDKTLDMQTWLDEGHIEGPLSSADEAFATLESSTTSAAQTLHEAVPGVSRQMDRVANGIQTARERIAEVKHDLREGLQGAREGLNGADTTVDDIEEVVAAINENRGSGSQGTLGKPVNDPTLANDIEEATESLREGTASFSRFKSYLGLRAEWDVLSRQGRVFLAAEVRARTDKFYYVELERGPLGGYPADEISDAAGTSTYYRRQEISDRIRFSAQFGKTFSNWFQVRGGIKESAFGIGADALVGSGRLRLSADLYGGSFVTPRLKLAGAVEVFRSMYLLAGIDDALNDPRELSIRKGGGENPKQFDSVRIGRDYFVGGMLVFDDADLSMLLRVYGALLVGLL